MRNVETRKRSQSKTPSPEEQKKKYIVTGIAILVAVLLAVVIGVLLINRRWELCVR